MRDSFLNIAGGLWTLLWVFWLIGALTSKRSVRRQTAGSRFLQALPVIAGFFLLFARGRWPAWLSQPWLPETRMTDLVGLVLTFLGIVFAIWARVWIGRNWSGTVTIKEQHQLIQNGPYAFVRHPIYSGLLLAFLGTAMIEGQVHAVVGFFLVVLGWWVKLRTEETFMTAQFGNTYSDYKKRVKALVPYVI